MVHNLYYTPLSSIIRKQLNESNDPPRDEEIDESKEKRECHRWTISVQETLLHLESKITSLKIDKNVSNFEPKIILLARSAAQNETFSVISKHCSTPAPLAPKGDAAAVSQLLSTLNAQYVC